MKLKRIIAMVLCVEMVLSTMSFSVFAEEATTSITTITNVEDLIAFANAVNSGDDYAGKTVTLTADLTLTDAWTSIGNGSRSGSSYTGNPFAGTFNGGNYTISGLTAPLFGIVTGTVKDVNLVANINDTTNDSVGAAVAVLVGGTVDDVDVSGTVTAAEAAGGVVGRVLAIGEVNNCDNTAAVTSTGSKDAAGGIVGKAYYTSTSGVMNITDCTNEGEINGGYAVGGIVGFSAANVSNCTNSGTVNSTGIEAGGIVGEQTNYGTINGNSNSADVTSGIAGGIVGWVRYQNNSSAYPLTETVAITNNTNTGSIASTTDLNALSCAGGIVGNVYNQATVTGNTNKAATISAATFAAGIVGALQPSSDNVDIDGATLTVTNNTSTTTAANITANCTALDAYNNVGDDATIEDNTVPSDAALLGTVTPALTSATTIWGEATGNASESFAIRLYSDDTLLVTATLNDPSNAIIDGNIELVTWNIPLNNAGTDSWWTVEWTNYITAATQPTKVVAVVDGVEVAENTYKLSAADDLNKIYAAVADADGKFTAYYTDVQEAIVAAAPAGTVEILADVTVDEWKMFWQGNKTFNDIIYIDMNGLTINGNNHTLTVNNIVSSGNGNQLFKEATELNVNDLTINVVNGTGGIGLESGSIKNVTFNGGTYGIYPGEGNITIEECTFSTNGTAVYFETARDNLVVTKNTFSLLGDSYAIILRGAAEFTDNTVISGKVNLVNDASGTVSGNDFGDNRFKVYNEATATIENNKINVLDFNNESEVKSTFVNNTLSEDAEQALEKAGVLGDTTSDAVKIGEKSFTTLDAALDYAKSEGMTEVEITVVNDIALSTKIEDFSKVTFTGTTREQTVDMNLNSSFEDDVALEFNDLTVSRLDTDWLYHYTYVKGGLTFNNCKMIGLFNVTAQDTNFIECDFYNDDTFGNGNYSIWLYNCFEGVEVNITDCTFDVYERAIKTYGDGYNGKMVLNISGTEFVSRTSDKTVVEMAYANGTGVGSVKLNITDSTATGFGTPEHIEGSENAWFNVEGNNSNSIVTIDNTRVWPVASWDGVTITNLDELKMFRDAVNGGDTYKGKTVTVTADIDLASEEWTPIGNYTNEFQGTFDGGNHTISNLVINGGTSSNQGFFGYTTDGEIKNLIINNAKVSGRLNVGVLAGTPYTSKYTNIKLTGHVEVNGMAYVGGVGGKNAYANWTDITVAVDSTSYVKAVSTENGSAYRTYVGGVIGFNGEGNHTFKNITSNIDVIGDVCDIGGIFGIAHYGNNFENITCAGFVTGPEGEAEIGGIAGVWHNQQGYTVTFTNCNYTGTSDVSAIGAPYSPSKNTAETSGTLIIDGAQAWPVVAKIGEKTFATLDAASKAAISGDTITLLADAMIAEGTDVTIPDGVTLNGNGYSILASGADHDTTTSYGYVVAGGELTIAGKTKIEKFSLSYYDHSLTIGEGASLEVFGKNRVTLAYGSIINVTGNIENAKTADKTGLTPSLSIPAGISITGSNDAKLNVKNAYVLLGSTTSKNSATSGTIELNFENSIAEFTNQLTFAEPTNGKTPTFNLNVKDSVLTTATKLIAAAPNTNTVIDNSIVTIETYFRNSGTMTIKNGSVLTGATIQFGENGGNDGATYVDASTLTINATSTGHALDGKGTGSITLTNGAKANIGYVTNMAVNVDGKSCFTANQILGTSTVAVDGSALEVGEEAKVIDLSGSESVEDIVTVSGSGVVATYGEDGDVTITKQEVPVAFITDAEGNVTNYTDLQTALKALTSDATLTLLEDVTITEAWDCRYNGAQITVPVTIDGNNKTIKLNGSIKDNNWNTVFRFEADATVKNLKIDASEASDIHRGISAKYSITVDNCTLIGNGTSAKLGVIFGEGAGADIVNVTATITNSTFKGWSYGVSDNQSGKDAKSVSVTGSTFTGASVLVSAAETITFIGNDVTEGYVNITSYTAADAVVVKATENTLVGTNDEITVNPENIEADDSFVTPVAKVGSKYYGSLRKAVTKAGNDDTITLVSDVEITNSVVIEGKDLTLDLGEYTIYDKNTTVLTSKDGVCGLIELKDNSKLTICGNGTIECNYTNVTGGWTGMAYAVNVDSTSELTVNSGCFTNGNGGIQTAGKVTINNGTFISHNGGTCVMATGVSANVTVNDGIFKDSVEEADVYTGSGAVWSGFGATVNINGGTYDFAADPEHDNIVWTLFPAQNAIAGYGSNADMTVTGGTFTNFNPETDAVVDWSATEGFTYGSVVADGYAALADLNGNYIVGVAPTATVNDLGATTVSAGDYMVYGNGSNTEDMPLSFVMQFLADQDEEDMETSPFAEWYGDFVITFTGIEDESFVADGCYLAGHYGSFGWVKVPVDGMTIEEGVRYPVMLGVGMGQKYDYICSGVEDFRCALYLPEDILEANPNLKVNLELSVVDNSQGEQAATEAIINNKAVYKVNETTYTAEDFKAEVEEVEKINIAGTVMNLGNSLNMKFFVKETDCSDIGYAKIVKSYADDRGDVTVEIPYSDWTVDEAYKGYKLFTYNGVAAKEMCDTFEVVIYNNAGKAISDPFTTSVRDYAMSIVKGNYQAKAKTVAVDMLNYGAASQTYFKYGTSDFANSLLTDEQKALATEDASYSDVTLEHSGTFLGTILTLESNILMKLYFSKVTSDMYAVVEFTDHNNNPRTINVPYSEFVSDNDAKYVKVEELAVADYQTVVTCTVYDGETVHAKVQQTVEQTLKTLSTSSSDSIYDMTAKFAASAYKYMH